MLHFMATCRIHFIVLRRLRADNSEHDDGAASGIIGGSQTEMKRSIREDATRRQWNRNVQESGNKER